jgi:1,4-alpha-glucan branching enzyme
MKDIVILLLAQLDSTTTSTSAPGRTRRALTTSIVLLSALGGEAWLNFIGNEFGHPEWLDFPRAGNGDSFHYARRQFHLADDPKLRYGLLAAWDAALNGAEAAHHWLNVRPAHVTVTSGGDRVVAFERNNLLFAFNFSPSGSLTDYRLGVEPAGRYKLVLDSDEVRFGGHGRLDHAVEHFTAPEACQGRPNSLRVYLPSRVALVFGRVD